jgi:hypothetical protein
LLLELLVEEPSMEAALDHLVPAILGPDQSYRIHAAQGKRALLKNLPHRLAGYQRQDLTETAICIVLDQDDEDCRGLKSQITDMAEAKGLLVLVRIAIEELEAWFFGDLNAIGSAYPGAESWIGSRPQFSSPDRILGGTAEALERALRRAGFHRGGLPKIVAASKIAPHMDVEANRSPSFVAFREGLRHRLRPARQPGTS